MIKRIALVAGLLLTIGGAAMAQDEAPAYTLGLGFVYKGVDKASPTWGLEGRVTHPLMANLDVALLGDWLFAQKGGRVAGVIGPAVHYNFEDMGGLIPYVGLGANFYFAKDTPGRTSLEVNAGAKYAMSEPWGLFGEVAWEAVKSKFIPKTPFDVRAGVTYGF